jgi:hypothetical protein
MTSLSDPRFEQLSSADAQVMLERLPERIKRAFIQKAAEIDYPVEAVLEMALAGYLDSEAIAFVDCKLDRGQRAA